MELRQIRYFIAAAQHLNFSEAAKKLYITQPTLSQQIADIEECLAVKLFERNGRNLCLTAAGEVFLKKAHEIMEKAKEAVIVTRRIRDGLVGKINIGFMTEAAKKFLPKMVVRFRENYPNIKLSMAQYTLWPLTRELKQGKIDIACMLAFDIDAKVFSWKTLYTDVLAVVVRAEHSLANRERVNFAEIAGEDFVIMSRDEGVEPIDQLAKAFENHGITPNVVSQQCSIDSVLMSIEAGMGISILPRCVEVYATPNIKFIALEETVTVDIVVAWLKEYTNPVIPLFVKDIEEALNRNLQG
ncbi:MAG: transcriptional regulator, LysR family [Firmicutes bacterium]|nr:transcriptional regulator, LysR family [Bacillota bacterium]